MERYYIWLVLALGEGEPEISRLIERFGTAEKVYKAFGENISLAGPELTAKAAKTSLEQADRMLKKLNDSGYRIITWESRNYPEHLRKIADPPCALFALGDISLLRKRLITVVGARDVASATAASIPKIIERLGRDHAVVSTLSEGCDQLTCLNAMKYGLSFIEVLPCGIGQTYPAGSRSLRRFLLSNGGLLISEYLPKTKANQGTFLRRSRILGGISEVTLVLQAGENSGSLATAEYSAAPIFLPPADIFSKAYVGTVRSVRNGAKLYLGEKSIENAFARAAKRENDIGGKPLPKADYRKQSKSAKAGQTGEDPSGTRPVTAEKPEKEISPLPDTAGGHMVREDFGTDNEFRVYGVLAEEKAPKSIEELIAMTGLSAGALAEILLDLEISGAVKAAGSRYSAAK